MYRIIFVRSMNQLGVCESKEKFIEQINIDIDLLYNLAIMNSYSFQTFIFIFDTIDTNEN